MKQKVTAVFDIGKSNKKFYLFDQQLNVVDHLERQFDETLDEDGDPCENLAELETWLRDVLAGYQRHPDYQIIKLNFSTYGASMVHLGRDDRPVCSFYSYLKPFPEKLMNGFFDKYGEPEVFSAQTASPIMGFLNSGLQLVYLKENKPEEYLNIQRSLHFPQYLSHLFTGKHHSEFTSIGCHTALWDFEKNDYHSWTERERCAYFLPEPHPSSRTFSVDINGQPVHVGIGIHDSSAALLPYGIVAPKPYVLLSSGTWNICMNPNNPTPITIAELHQDCLNFLDPSGRPVKASRLFMGRHLSEQVKLLSAHFHQSEDAYKSMKWHKNISWNRQAFLQFDHRVLQPERFGLVSKTDTDLSRFTSYEEAYFALMDELTAIQVASLELVTHNSPVEHIYIDGGFAQNEVFTSMLASKLPGHRIYRSEVANGSALGAAMVINEDIKPALDEHIRSIQP